MTLARGEEPKKCLIIEWMLNRNLKGVVFGVCFTGFEVWLHWLCDLLGGLGRHTESSIWEGWGYSAYT